MQHMEIQERADRYSGLRDEAALQMSTRLKFKNIMGTVQSQENLNFVDCKIISSTDSLQCYVFIVKYASKILICAYITLQLIYKQNIQTNFTLLIILLICNPRKY